MEPSPLWWLLSPPPQDRSESCAGQDLIMGFGFARMAHCSASSAFGLQHPLPAWQPRAMHMLRNACRPSTAPPTRSQDSFHRRIAAQVGQRKRACAHTIRQSSRRQTLAGCFIVVAGLVTVAGSACHPTQSSAGSCKGNDCPGGGACCVDNSGAAACIRQAACPAGQQQLCGSASGRIGCRTDELCVIGVCSPGCLWGGDCPDGGICCGGSVGGVCSVDPVCPAGQQLLCGTGLRVLTACAWRQGRAV
jgi:hypothetical protein